MTSLYLRAILRISKDEPRQVKTPRDYSVAKRKHGNLLSLTSTMKGEAPRRSAAPVGPDKTFAITAHFAHYKQRMQIAHLVHIANTIAVFMSFISALARGCDARRSFFSTGNGNASIYNANRNARCSSQTLTYVSDAFTLED